jgi:hypothetical protein
MIDPGRESGSRDRVFAGDGGYVRHLAYAEYTPPKWATWPTPQTLKTNNILGVDAGIISFEGGAKH